MNAATEHALRAEMDALRRQIEESYALHPSDFDTREPLWAKRESLRARLK